MAESILAQLENKKTLRLTPVIVPVSPHKNDFLGAVTKENIEGIKEAVKAGANPNILISKNWNLLMLLSSPQGGSFSANYTAVKAKEEFQRRIEEHRDDLAELTRFLLQNGANPDLQDPYGRTALFLATMSNRANIAEILLENGADPNKRNKDSISPEHLAEVMGHYAILKMIVDWKSKEEIHPR